MTTPSLARKSSPPETPILELVAARRTHGSGATAVTSIAATSLSIPAGQSVAVVGPSGSGKTTLLSLLSLIDTPDAGRIEFEGRDTARLSADERADIRRDRIGLVFQMFHLVPALDALHNVMLPLLPYRRRGAIEPRARDLLARVGLGNRLSHRPGQLSGGEQQRVAIARSLLSEPAVVLADEPTGNLDSATGTRVTELLLRLHRSVDFTLVVATHDNSLADRMERRISLADGTVQSDTFHRPIA